MISLLRRLPPILLLALSLVLSPVPGAMAETGLSAAAATCVDCCDGGCCGDGVCQEAGCGVLLALPLASLSTPATFADLPVTSQPRSARPRDRHESLFRPPRS